jgi:hypothetical protein
MPELPPPTNIQALQALFDASRVANLSAAQHEQLKAFGLQLAKFIEYHEPKAPLDAAAPTP